MGWMLLKQDPKRIGRADATDLYADKLVTFQHRYYVLWALTFGIIFPSAIAGVFWNDWKGGAVYAGILRFFFVQQSTFSINSLAHYMGEQPFDDRNSPRDNVFTALVTLGEGYHNFHHEFPSDYREWIPLLLLLGG
jgi:stearoyl-CoA desaturase (delta-9 desaturase)